MLNPFLRVGLHDVGCDTAQIAENRHFGLTDPKMSTSGRFHRGALFIVTWDNTVPDIAIRLGVCREYCCIT